MLTNKIGGVTLPTLLVAGNLRATGSEKQKDLDNQIPIEYIIDWFKSRINKSGAKNRVLILESKTGSGKSTVMPAHIFQHLYKLMGERIIAVTQPRVLTTIDIVTTQLTGTSFYPFFKLGKTIGYQTGPSKFVTNFGVTFMTVGSLLMTMKNMTDEEIINKYSMIILDEVHEMSLDLANLLYQVKGLVERNSENSNLPFIVATSATFETQKYLDYFSLTNSNFIKVEGSSFEKTPHWPPSPIQDAVYSAAKLALTLHKQKKNDPPTRADILIFLSSKMQIKTVSEILEKANKEFMESGEPVFMPLIIDRPAVQENKPDFQVMNAHPDKLTVNIGGKLLKPARRIVMATTVAETGLTLDYLQYVIDTGFSNSPEYYPSHDISGLITKPASQSRVIQRIGRVGRKFPGDHYHMYTEELFNKLPKVQFSDIITSDITKEILSILYGEIKTIKIKKRKEVTENTYEIFTQYNPKDEPALKMTDIDFIDAIPIDTLHNSLTKLYALGFISPVIYDEPKLDSDAIDKNCPTTHSIPMNNRTKITPDWKFHLTPLGVLSKLSIPVELSKMIVSSYAWGCSPMDMITIATYILLDKSKMFRKLDWKKIYSALPSHFSFNANASELAHRNKLLIADEFIDGLLLFHSLLDSMKLNRSDIMPSLRGHCAEIGIEMADAMLFFEKRDQIIEQFIQVGFNLEKGHNLYETHEENFMNYIVKLKYCIYEGFRLNVLTYDIKSNKYVSYRGLSIEVPDMLKETQDTKGDRYKYSEKPIKIITNKFSLRYDKKKNIYIPIADLCSVLDGYVHSDDQFNV